MTQVGGSVGASYTFAVCKSCGVQSPPIINVEDAKRILDGMGWKMESHRFTVIATCPECQKGSNECP